MASRKRGNFKLLGAYSHYVPGWADLCVLVLFFLIGVVLGNVVSSVFVIAGGEGCVEYATVVAYVLMFIPAMMYASSKSSRRSVNTPGVKMDSSHFGKPGGVLCALMAVVGVLAVGYCVDAVTAVMPPMPEWLETALNSMTEGNMLLNIFCVGICAAFFEEWLCRGMVLRGLLGTGVKPAVAIPVSALFFAIIHLNPWQAIPAFILGCFFGFVYYKTGSLKLTMLMHFTNNTFAVLLSHVESFKDMETWMDVLPTYLYWIIWAACLLLTVLIVRKYSSIPLEQERGNLDGVKSLFEE